MKLVYLYFIVSMITFSMYVKLLYDVNTVMTNAQPTKANEVCENLEEFRALCNVSKFI